MIVLILCKALAQDRAQNGVLMVVSQSNLCTYEGAIMKLSWCVKSRRFICFDCHTATREAVVTVTCGL